MNRIQCLVIRAILEQQKSLTFGQLLKAIGDKQYISLWNALDQMVARGWLNRWPDLKNDMIYLFAPTSEGCEVYQSSKDQYSLEFETPIQRRLGV